MSPTKFNDIGKTVKDLFNRDFGYGEVKVELTSKSTSGVDLKTTHTKNNTVDDILGDFEAKHSCAAVSFTHKWSTKNVFTETISSSALLEGLKSDLEASFDLSKGMQSSKVKLDYQHPRVRMLLDGDLFNGPNVTASAVYSVDGVMIGAEGGYNLNTGAVTKTNLALDYTHKDLGFALLSDCNKVNLLLHHAMNDRLESAAQLAADPVKATADLSVMTRYVLNDGSAVK
eukprot:Ihof_evm18s33 gene=Ihof_evmTU18s33